MTQQNAAMSEEATAASRLPLANESEILLSLVSQFRATAPADEDLRRQLETAAPHAFATREAGGGAARARLGRPTDGRRSATAAAVAIEDDERLEF